MAETYSLSVTAMDANNTRYTPATLKVGDSVCASAGDEQNAMRVGQQVLCKRADGSQAWYTLDPVRSVPGGSLVLQAV
jgi:hypothetical protein